MLEAARWMLSVWVLLQLLTGCGISPGPKAPSGGTPNALTDPPLTITTSLSLGPDPIQLGTTATASVTYTNNTSSTISVQGIYITSRPPGGTQEGGPFDAFSPNLGALSLAPGASQTLTATRAFSSADPIGAWYAYATYQDAAGAWQNGPLVDFQVTASSPPSPGSSPWSIAFYPGWVQSTLSPSQLDYSAFTHIYHFGMYPDDTGHVQLADMQSPSYPLAAVSAAHAAGRMIVLVIGGEAQGTHFVNSTTPSNVSTFVQSIVSTMRQYGYDGVDIDWEESFTPGQFVPLMNQLSAALSQLSPKPLLSVEVDVGQVPAATIGQVSSLVDSVNCMCYWDDGLSSLAAYTQAGVPASKFVLGMGWSAGYADTTQSAVQTKVQEAQQHGLRGVDGWQVGDLAGPTTDPRLIPLRSFVSSGGGRPPSATVPGAPSGVTAAAGEAQATLSWTAPSSNGGQP